MQIFSSNEFRVKFLSRKLLSRNFSEKMVAVNFRKQFPYCGTERM